MRGWNLPMIFGAPSHGGFRIKAWRGDFKKESFGHLLWRNLYCAGGVNGFEKKALMVQQIFHWLARNENLVALLVTAGVAILLVCCMGCSKCPRCKDDDFFRRNQL